MTAEKMDNSTLIFRGDYIPVDEVPGADGIMIANLDRRFLHPQEHGVVETSHPEKISGQSDQIRSLEPDAADAVDAGVFMAAAG